ERIAHHAIASPAGENRLLQRRLGIRSRIDHTADVGILALDILAHDIEIDLARIAPLQRALDPLEQSHRPQIDILVELATDRDEQPPERNVIGNPGEADGAEIDRIESTKLI